MAAQQDVCVIHKKGGVARLHIIRSHLKIRIFGRNQGAFENQPTGIHQYVEDLRRRRYADFGRKDFFKIASADLRLAFNLNMIEQIKPF